MHAGFQPDAQLATSSMSDEEGCSPTAPVSTDATAAWAALCDSVDVPFDVYLGDCIAVDTEVIAREELGDEAIIENV